MEPAMKILLEGMQNDISEAKGDIKQLLMFKAEVMTRTAIYSLISGGVFGVIAGIIVNLVSK